MDVPVTGTEGSPYPRPGSWQVSTGYRCQKSDRHYVGSESQPARDADSSQVVNRVPLLDLAVRYNWTQRTSLSLSLPYFIASRSNPIRDQNRVVFDRSVTHSNSISDSSFMARRWMKNPDSCKNGNFSLGLGLKAPTGDSDHTDVRRAFTGGRIVTSVVPVDQSIQPGDGGWGFRLEGTGFRRFVGRAVGYASRIDLLNAQVQMPTDPRGNDPHPPDICISVQLRA